MDNVDTCYPPIADYALLSDCHCTALVSRAGSVDWCCMPRVDADSCFGRILDWARGGYCAIMPAAEYASSRRYIPGTMVLETRFRTAAAEVLLTDFFAMDSAAGGAASFALVRIVECISGSMPMRVDICPRFDFGDIVPRMRRHGSGAYTAIGSNQAMVIHANVPLEVIGNRDLKGAFEAVPGTRIHLSICFQPPDMVEHEASLQPSCAGDIEDRFRRTCEWWRNWAGRIRPPADIDNQTSRSIIILKSLTYEVTGAIVAAPTTSLPECIGGARNWDYRYSWIRDSVFTVDALYQLGYEDEADRFLNFIRRSSAGSAEQLQIMYAVDGKRRLTEVELDWLEGYRQSKPVRAGNFAAKQKQLDVYGAILEIAWAWHSAGHPIDKDYWDFLTDVIDAACRRWKEPDHSIWEFRKGPRHYVHSKAMCWAAIDHGIKLAQANRFAGPFEYWEQARDKLRAVIEDKGFDSARGVFLQAFGSDHLDAALLLLPEIGFLAYEDPRMLRTVDAICETLDKDGLLARYNSPDGLPGREGAFLPCTFWLVKCLARQGRRAQAWEYYRRACACANDVGLFSEEYDVANRLMLGNFPQGLSHVSQVTARLALAGSEYASE
jgi:GH15 family glucan-1,4-alpha-glucosidase